MVAILALGQMVVVRNTFPLYCAIFAVALYPISLALVYTLDTALGWQ